MPSSMICEIGAGFAASLAVVNLKLFRFFDRLKNGVCSMRKRREFGCRRQMVDCALAVQGLFTRLNISFSATDVWEAAGYLRA